MKNDNLSWALYISPEASIIEVINEGVLCGSGSDSTESLGENPGTWG